MNSVQLIGRLTKEVDLKFTSSGTAVGNFTLAVNRSFTNQQGEREADFILCQIWRTAAQNLAKYTRKGSQIGITGRIQTRNYENQQGQRVYVTEVVVDQFDLLDPKESTESRPQSNSVPTVNNQSNLGQTSYNATQNQSNMGQNQTNWEYNKDANMIEGQRVNISEDELPF